MSEPASRAQRRVTGYMRNGFILEQNENGDYLLRNGRIRRTVKRVSVEAMLTSGIIREDQGKLYLTQVDLHVQG